MSNNIKVDLNIDGIKEAVNEAVSDYVQSGELEYDCPDCGKPIKITGRTNTCECGFVLTVELGELEL